MLEQTLWSSAHQNQRLNTKPLHRGISPRPLHTKQRSHRTPNQEQAEQALVLELRALPCWKRPQARCLKQLEGCYVCVCVEIAVELHDEAARPAMINATTRV